MTRRLYYDDCYLTTFRARVVGAAPDPPRVYLDATAFYPTSGGQPFDTGRIAGALVTDVVDEDGRVAHLVQPAVADGEVHCQIDWPRRFDHMQQHTGQHLLSAVLQQQHGIPTVSFHLGAETSTIEVAAAGLDPAQVVDLERHANEVIFENRPVAISHVPAAEAEGLRKPSEREGMLRVVSIDGLDRSACGGTHVRSTAEIGLVLIRKIEKIRGQLRIEFLCGMRAVRRARADYEALSKTARIFSASLDEAPALVAQQLEQLQDAEKHRRRLASSLAEARGKDLYRSTKMDEDGVRRHVLRIGTGPLDAELRAEAQGFTAGSKAVFLVLVQNTGAVLLATSADTGLHAGEMLKPVMARLGGRGGGGEQMAQGSVPTAEALQEVEAAFGRFPAA